MTRRLSRLAWKKSRTASRTRPAGQERSRGLALGNHSADFHAVFETSSEALVVIDKFGYVREANHRARNLLRIEEGSAGRTALSETLCVKSAEELSRHVERISGTMASRRDERDGVEVSLRNGFPVRITVRVWLSHRKELLVCFEERGAARGEQDRTFQLQAELLSVLDSVEEGIVLFDGIGRVRFVNANFARLFSLDARRHGRGEDFRELEKLVISQFRDPSAFAGPRRSFQAGEGLPSHDELELVRPSRRILERFARAVQGPTGRPAGWLEVYYDVTGQRQIQANLLQTEKMAAMGQLVSGIAHELNNPLTAIMGYAQLLLGHGLLPVPRSEASRVFQEAERARRIVKNLLYFARENKPERSRANLNEIIERTLALRSYELKVENIAVECTLEKDLPETMADPYQLQQVILNLLVNAEQAILQGHGQGRVSIQTRWTPADRLIVEVSDDGPGIAPETMPRIFDPFFTTKPSGVGTGLGLSIVYGIVHQHGGKVTAESQLGRGAKFVVEIPLVAPPAEEHLSNVAILPSRPLPAKRGRILVVEDESTVAQLIVDVLQEEGHEVEAVLDSQEGLTKLSRSRYDLVICDLRMPRLDGPAFFEALVRAGDPIRDHILFITGDTLAPRTFEFLESGSFPYLGKPFLVEELKLAVNRLLEARTQKDRETPAGGVEKWRGMVSGD